MFKLLAVWMAAMMMPPVAEAQQWMTNHGPCYRDCSADPTPRECYFHFKEEFYTTLAEVCGNCSQGVVDDCYRSQCVPGDGFARTIYTINRQIPGPSIQVCLNDIIIVDLEVGLLGHAETLHWHGLLQRETPWFDGVAWVTQCPVLYGNTFQYRFKADTAGTYFWHSHSGLHKVNGIFGALVIRHGRTTDPHFLRYDYDLPEHVIILNDWMHTEAEYRFPGLVTGIPGQPSDSCLINGRGQTVVSLPRSSQTLPEPIKRERTFGLSFALRAADRTAWRLGNTRRYASLASCLLAGPGHQRDDQDAAGRVRDRGRQALPPAHHQLGLAQLPDPHPDRGPPDDGHRHGRLRHPAVSRRLPQHALRRALRRDHHRQEECGPARLLDPRVRGGLLRQRGRHRPARPAGVQGRGVADAAHPGADPRRAPARRQGGELPGRLRTAGQRVRHGAEGAVPAQLLDGRPGQGAVPGRNHVGVHCARGQGHLRHGLRAVPGDRCVAARALAERHRVRGAARAPPHAAGRVADVLRGPRAGVVRGRVLLQVHARHRPAPRQGRRPARRRRVQRDGGQQLVQPARAPHASPRHGLQLHGHGHGEGHPGRQGARPRGAREVPTRRAADPPARARLQGRHRLARRRLDLDALPDRQPRLLALPLPFPVPHGCRDGVGLPVWEDYRLPETTGKLPQVFELPALQIQLQLG